MESKPVGELRVRKIIVQNPRGKNILPKGALEKFQDTNSAKIGPY